MKKTKVYRPRRGIRFVNGPRGILPPGYFIGAEATRRNRPSDQEELEGSVVVTGSIQRSIYSPPDFYVDPARPVVTTSSLRLNGSVSVGRSYERRKYNAQLLGLQAAQVGRRVWPSSAVMETSATGTLESPSWTHASIGLNHSFVISPLSSSYRHETVGMNLFFSGTEPLENTAVPASASLFYSKHSRYQTITVKHTASALDTVVPFIPGTSTPMSGVHVPATFVAVSGVLLNTVTGTNGPNRALVTCPATIFVNVPVSGRLVDIRVWVEVTHNSSSFREYPLGVFGVALRSPNVTWGLAHPYLNDPIIFPLLNGTRYLEGNGVPWDFYRDTFLLWEGGNLFGNDTGPEVGTINNGGRVAGSQGGTDTTRYPTFQKDMGIRTVFYDGARVPNPRELYSVNPSGNFDGAPNAALGINSAYGCAVPWTSDATLQPGGTYSAAGSPPAGWLTGPGGTTASFNEWPTTGSNYGASSIRPVYPLLDPLFVKKRVGDETFNGLPIDYLDTTKAAGFRPGLRGTEISGTWQILFATTIGAANFYSSTSSMEAYMRQVRVEIVYETGFATTPSLPRRSLTRYQPRRAGDITMFRMSGSWDPSPIGDYFVNQVMSHVPGQAQIGRTFGLVLNSGSSFGPPVVDFACLYRLTGTLAGISGSAPGWLLNNFSGMPSIPASSASLSPPSIFSGSTQVTSVAGIISPNREVGIVHRLDQLAEDINPRRSLAELAIAFVSSSAT